ncbi:hypothetical protein K435DRAFT_124542 [Dendrothele bispora CBS 962.96]|uniref:Uncharacterized protein n=1 Tax=Dendrothele bispora (strain CBS 962.96) TaxID=1314807 RepID=A0A4V6T4W0_DENBC|nr:hypothetical protein K435DRAFT_124542 [Dendrothele bispora CBS 962.96]
MEIKGIASESRLSAGLYYCFWHTDSYNSLDLDSKPDFGIPKYGLTPSALVYRAFAPTELASPGEPLWFRALFMRYPCNLPTYVPVDSTDRCAQPQTRSHASVLHRQLRLVIFGIQHASSELCSLLALLLPLSSSSEHTQKLPLIRQISAILLLLVLSVNALVTASIQIQAP